MSRDEIRKLLGSYATDTLSETERSALFAAALEDQELFNELAKEQALRDVLRDPSARQQLIDALGPPRETLRWLRKPAVWAMVGSMAALLIVAALMLRQTRHASRGDVIVADAIATRPPAAAPPSAAPLRVPEPAVVVRQPKQLARLPAVGALSAARPEAKTAPAPPPPPQAVGGLAVVPQAQSQMVQVTPSPRFVAQQRATGSEMAVAKAEASAAANLAVEFTLLLKGAEGTYAAVPSNTVFHARDSVRIQVAPNYAGYIYLLQRDEATAAWKVITSQRVENAQPYALPTTGGIQSDVPARLELLLVLSRQEQPALAAPQAADLVALPSSKITLEFR
jgi:hypothetical protein